MTIYEYMLSSLVDGKVHVVQVGNLCVVGGTEELPVLPLHLLDLGLHRHIYTVDMKDREKRELKLPSQ
jgi:hypothetical protein